MTPDIDPASSRENGETPPRSTEPAGPPLPLFGQEDKRVPQRIGPFKILDVISRSMAVVYKAEQDNPKRVVALKLPRGGKLLSSESRERFMREVRLAASLDHAGIVPVLDAGEIDGVPYYSMPYIEGRPIDKHVEMENPPLDTRLDLFLRLCSVVQALHDKGLVHRDLKPANVLVDRHGDVRLLDFGLARAVEDDAAISSDQALLGTIQYMAPEQTLAGTASNITAAADVYSLGVILYGLLTGAVPYPADGPRDAALAQVRDATVQPPSKINPAVSPHLDAVVLTALHKKPARRFANAGALEHALREAIAGRRPAGVATAGSSGGTAAALTVAGLVIAVVGLVFLFNKGTDEAVIPAPTSTTTTSIPEKEPVLPVAVTIPPIQVVPTTTVPADAVAIVTTTVPPPQDKVAGPPELDIRLYGIDELRRLPEGQPPTGGDRTMPRAMWAPYEQTLKVLRQQAKNAGRGAILIGTKSAVPKSQVRVRISSPTAAFTPATRHIEGGGAMAVYVPAGAECRVEAHINNKPIRKNAKPARGEVVFLEF